MDVVIVQPFAGVNGLLHDPPVSRTGNKRRFRPVLEGIFGYHRRDVRLEWANDLDLGCWLLALCYASPELAQAVSRIISSWVPCPECLPDMIGLALEGMGMPTPESIARACKHLIRTDCPVCAGSGVQDARQLWERLRREPIPEDVSRAAAAWAALQTGAYSNLPVVPWDQQHAWGMVRDDVTGTITYDDRRDGTQPHSAASRFASLSRSRSRSAPSIVTRLDAGLVTPERFAGVLAQWMVMQSRSPAGKAVVGDETWKDHGFRYEFDPTGDHDGTHARGWQNPRWTLASAIRSSDTPAIVSRLDAGAVVPDVLAQYLYLQSRAFSQKPVTPTIDGWDVPGWCPEWREPDRKGQFGGAMNPRWALAESVSSLPGGSLLAIDAPEGDYPTAPTMEERAVAIAGGDLRALDPDWRVPCPEPLPLPSTLPWMGRAYRVVVYLDPPYSGTTGYGSTCERSSYVVMVRRWLEAGKASGVPVTVGISEACDLAEELGDATGQRWHGYEIGSMVKRGSSFWGADDVGEKKQREWMTCSSPAVRLPAVQQGLWG